MAVETSLAFVVYGGGGPPLPCAGLRGIVQLANVTGLEQVFGAGGCELTISISEPVLPVFVVPRKRFPVVFVYVPAVADVTLTAIVHVPFAATVIFENDRGSLTVAGEGEAPQPV